ncbi:MULTISPECIES: RluA family pseudouridine synthase [unclassified Cyanobium]|uniref:pseudouridine synthase n=1 Tax=unclassified Cyanobium TaxID=2627006 RepID=UPI0020CCE331|nr:MULTISPECIES: RluA family pseudouridine synthase [unclassified Cyanobium]MCP9833870.1 RluA family pseudouridine synthase [Cyanobium sp. La Preciosa 7G6]MCP9936634.1 RluA family pseudouridine synthase [Cyanobium sp. Aljojuca 7A6]
MRVVAYYAGRYPHSGAADWQRRLDAGEISRNGEPLRAEAILATGDRLLWRRSPWQEPAVPVGWGVIHDDGDLLVIDKPSGLPVLPAGGFLEHTVLRLLERQSAAGPAGAPPPRPVHRLGRFTSGLLVCARRPATRAWLSQRLRDSSAAGEGEAPSCRKLYRTLLLPGGLQLELGEALPITIAIGRRAHPLLGTIWCAAPDGLAAISELTLLRRHPDGDLAQVEIATGRPHQIRIHCAAIGAPLLGDPLYLAGGSARAEVLPGEGGYRLHAHRLALAGPDGASLTWEAPLPKWGQGG